jgi:co-chaperonin GroES (HSP10)
MKVIPFGDRILVKRKVIGKTLGSGILIAPDETADRPTDLAEVMYVPDNSFADSSMLGNIEKITTGLKMKATDGDSDALIALLRFNEYVKMKSIKVGDTVLISKYVGVDFLAKESNKTLTLVSSSDIIGIVKND